MVKLLPKILLITGSEVAIAIKNAAKEKYQRTDKHPEFTR
jgi:hypothetical protein